MISQIDGHSSANHPTRQASVQQSWRRSQLQAEAPSGIEEDLSVYSSANIG